MVWLWRISGVGTVRLIGIIGSCTIVVVFHHTHRNHKSPSGHIWRCCNKESFHDQRNHSLIEINKCFSTVSARWIFCIFANLCKNLVLELQIMSLIREMQGMQFSKCKNIKLIPVLQNELFSLKPNIEYWKIW